MRLKISRMTGMHYKIMELTPKNMFIYQRQ
jgi:hypothetical protein